MVMNASAQEIPGDNPFGAGVQEKNDEPNDSENLTNIHMK